MKILKKSRQLSVGSCQSSATRLIPLLRGAGRILAGWKLWQRRIPTYPFFSKGGEEIPPLFKEGVRGSSKLHSNLLILTLCLVIIPLFYGCSIVKKVAGADIDPQQFALAREAKMYEIRSNSSASLEQRLEKPDPIENADIICLLSEDFLNKVTRQYDSTIGWFDESTTYKIKDVKLAIHNGCAISSIAMLATSQKYNVDVDLTMDCILTLELSGTDLALKLEPFNISPNVTAKGLLSSADEIIQNLLKINLSKLGSTIPEIKIPLNISNRMQIPGTRTEIKDKVNLLIVNPDRFVDYRLKIKEILFFEKKAFVALNLEKVEVR